MPRLGLTKHSQITKKLSVKLKQTQLENLSETLEDFRALLPRYVKLKGNSVLLKKFCSRNRNPVWDLTKNSYFKTGLCSEMALTSKNVVDDHYIQRSRAIKFIFEELEKKPDMTISEFISVIKRYCSTVRITKEEHQLVTQFTKRSKNLNFESYLACGIKIEGLSEHMLQ